MNKIYITLILSLSLFVTSCSDFLTDVNPNAVTAEEFWTTKENLKKGLNSVYAALQFEGVSGVHAIHGGMIISDEAIPNKLDGSVLATMNGLNFDTNKDYMERVWVDMYTGVFRANQVIENAPDIEMDDELRTRYIAEARFLRGWYYFWLSNYFNKGSIVLHSEVPKTKEDYSKKLSTKSEVDTFIVHDLQFAMANLPEQQDELGRVTWGAATAMLGKYYLYNQKWEFAAMYFKKIIDKSGENGDLYNLVEDYQWNFDEAHEFNAESIFEVSYSTAFKEGMPGGTHDTDKGSEATGIEKSLAPGKQVGGFRKIVPSYPLMITMMNDEMDATNIKNEGRKYPLRATSSIAICDDEYAPYWGVALPDKKGDNIKFNQRSAGYIKKYTNWETRTSVDLQDNRSGLNVRKIRLADVYLMYAEAVLNDNGDTDEATKYINLVRNRAAVKALDINDDTTPESILKFLMYTERPCELSFEGQGIRWHDLRRWGKLGERFKEVAQTPVYWKHTGGAPQKTPPRLATEDDRNEDGTWPADVKFNLEEAAGSYSPNKDYWPLPPAELLNNSQLTK